MGSASDAVVDRRRSRELDDAIRPRVVPIGRREIDDLEVRRELAQELEGLCGALLVERDEWIVEDERRPAATGHESDEAEPGRQVDQVDGAL